MSVAERISSEGQLLDLFRACGFDFTSVARDITTRFPREPHWGVPSFGILPYRLTHAFAGFGTLWKIPVNRDSQFDLPPTQYFHEFYPSENVRWNFDRALEQLTAIFGPGHSGISTNVYERNWRIGFFAIQLIAWPRELNTQFTNVMEGHNPYLWIAANIYIQPDFPFIHPTEDASRPIEELLSPSESCRLVFDSPVYLRRNRISPASPTPVAGIASNDFLIRTSDRTVRVPLDQIQEVLLTRLTRARFSGSSSISLNTIFNRHQVQVSVATGEGTDSLDKSSRHLSQAIARPLKVEEYPDEG